MSEDRELFSDRMLEGEYTTWRPVWEYDIGVLSNITRLSVDNDGTVYIGLTVADWTWVRSYAGATQSLFNHRLLGVASTRSVTDKYVLIWDNTTPTLLEIWRRGAQIATITITTADPALASFGTVAQSPNGKFIATVCATGAGWLVYVVLWEGV